MADEQTSQNAAPATPPSDPGQAKQASRKAPPSSDKAPAASPQDKQQAPPDVVSREDFQRMQSNLTRQAQQAQQQTQRMEQELRSMRQEMLKLQTKDLDEDQATIVQMRQQMEEMQEAIRQRDEYLRNVQIERQADDEIFVMAQEAEVPFAELKRLWLEGKTPQEIWRYAMRQTKERLTKAQMERGQEAAQQLADVEDAGEEEATRRRTDNEVDLGQGRASREEHPAEVALRNRDAKAFARLFLDK